MPGAQSSSSADLNRAPAILRIDLAAIAANYRLLKKRTAAMVSGVVKADAYGLGLEPVTRTLLSEGCRMFFVATPDEGAAVRAISDKAEILVLGGLYDGTEDFYVGRGLMPVLNSLEECDRWAAAAGRFGRKLPAALHFDTGMNRLGLPPFAHPETRAFDVRLVMSHFAASDEKNHPLNVRQAEIFAKAAAMYPAAAKSLCNSSGMFRSPEWHYDAVRPGYALYGGNPLPEQANPMRPVLSLHARVLQVRDVRQGETAGYNATYKFRHDSRTATVALGYADGFPRSGSNAAKFYWQGQACPVRGRVSMDLTIIETGHLENPPGPGDWIEVIGGHQTIDALAKDCGTIGYDVLTALGPRYARVYSS